MDMNVADAEVAVEAHGTNKLLHAPPDTVAEDDDVMVDLSCFGGGGGCYNAAMEEADHQDLMENAAAIFCEDLIPPLPDFQCMSSNSSSSSTAVKRVSSYQSTASSSTSSSSWTVLRSDGGDHQQGGDAGVYMHSNGSQSVALNQKEHVVQTRAPSSMDCQMKYGNKDASNGLDDDIGCMDVMETLGYMDLLDDNDQVWDYNDSFDFQQTKDSPNCCNLEEQHGFENKQQTNAQDIKDYEFIDLHVNNEKGDNLDDGLDKSEDLAVVFFEWLKSNKESISAEDLRSIKLRKSTIESAAKRLGNGKDGMKRLLQLILEWVQQHQLLQRKRSRDEEEAAAAVGQNHFQPQMYPVQYPSQTFQNNTTDPNLNEQPSQTQFTVSANPTQWQMKMGSGGAEYDPMMAVGIPAAGGIIGGDPYGNNNECHHFSNMADQPAAAWPAAPPFCMNYNNNANSSQNLTPQPYPFGTTFNQYPYHYYPAVGNGNNIMNGNVNAEGLAKTGSVATREARKKRMMKQRRGLPHHRHHHHNSSSNGHHHNNNGHFNQINMHVDLGMAAGSHSRFNMDENCANMGNMGHPGSGNWTYWQKAAPLPPNNLLVPIAGKSLQANEASRLPLQQMPAIASEMCQGSKPEKNLRFLLQKVLKQSDVGSLGRIVLPKKEAENLLPQLIERDGINIAMEDIGTSQVWNMRYRFWPNNKSRMYLLENTGKFVESNGLQEGDFIVIYSDIKYGKYMIRGVKVRQQDPKSDPKRCGKAIKKNPSSTLNSSPSGTPKEDPFLKSEEHNMDLQMHD